MIAVPKNRGWCGEPDAHKGIRGVTVPLTGRMNNATTLLLQRSVREHVADQLRCFFFYRDSLPIGPYASFALTVLKLLAEAWGDMV